MLIIHVLGATFNNHKTMLPDLRWPWNKLYLIWHFSNALNVFLLMSFQPVLHDWCNNGSGMYYFVCGIMHIKELLLLIGKSSSCGGSGFPLSLSEWSFTMTDAIQS